MCMDFDDKINAVQPDFEHGNYMKVRHKFGNMGTSPWKYRSEFQSCMESACAHMSGARFLLTVHMFMKERGIA